MPLILLFVIFIVWTAWAAVRFGVDPVWSKLAVGVGVAGMSLIISDKIAIWVETWVTAMPMAGAISQIALLIVVIATPLFIRWRARTPSIDI